MSDYRDSYLRKMERMGSSKYDRGMKYKQRDFVNYFSNALNKEDCIIDGIKTKAVFQDHSQSNNKDLSDDKYVIVPNDVNANVGSYINWHDSDWLVFTEENKTIPTHQQMKVKVVNWFVKWIVDGEISNKGLGWGAYVQNQTLYTLGVSYSGNAIDIINAKMMMYVQNNEETRKLNIGKRVFIGQNVYKIMFADTVSRAGLINLLMEEDRTNEYDNKELLIADYYNHYEDTNDTTPPTTDAKINGETVAKISRTYMYEISDGAEVAEWIIESIEGDNQPCYVLERDSKAIRLQFKDDFRYVGQNLNIIAKLSDQSIVSLTVMVAKKF